MSDPLLSVSDLSKRYGGRSTWWSRRAPAGVQALDGVSFALPRGRTLALVGESGCGKSTLAKCVMGVVPPTGGEIVFDGVPIARLPAGRRPLAIRRRMQMVFQDPYASLNPRWRVRDIVAEPVRFFGLADDESAVARAVDRRLVQVGLRPEDAAKYPHQFSGGQRQRISIARALAAEADLLVLDEPTSALDVSVQAQILNLMKALQDELQLTYVLISHNMAVVRQMADMVGVLYLGRLVELRASEALFEAPAHPYTQLLLDAVPRTDRIGRRPPPPAGDSPSPLRPPPGCHFHPRCPRALDVCRISPPALAAMPGGHIACHDPIPAPTSSRTPLSLET